MITLDYIISDHKGAGRDALQKICDYADVTGQIVFLTVDSYCIEFGIEGSPEKDAALFKFYEKFGFVASDRPYEWEGEITTKNNMERKPNDHLATVQIR